MRSRVGYAFNRAQVGIGNFGTPITLQWVTISGGVTDPSTKGILPGTGTQIVTTSGVMGLIHTSEAKSVLRQYAEIEQGDLIVDLPPGVVIDGLPNLRFIITVDGLVQQYEQKQLGDKLSQAWDLIVAGQPMVRTVLLKKAT